MVGFGETREEAEKAALRIGQRRNWNLMGIGKKKTTTTYLYTNPDGDVTSLSVRERDPQKAGTPKIESKIKKK